MASVPLTLLNDSATYLIAARAVPLLSNPTLSSKQLTGRPYITAKSKDQSFLKSNTQLTAATLTITTRHRKIRANTRKIWRQDTTTNSKISEAQIDGAIGLYLHIQVLRIMRRSKGILRSIQDLGVNLHCVRDRVRCPYSFCERYSLRFLTSREIKE